MPASEDLRTLNQLINLEIETRRLKAGIETAAARLRPHAEVHPWVATVRDTLLELIGQLPA